MDKVRLDVAAYRPCSRAWVAIRGHARQEAVIIGVDKALVMRARWARIARANPCRSWSGEKPLLQDDRMPEGIR